MLFEMRDLNDFLIAVIFHVAFEQFQNYERTPNTHVHKVFDSAREPKRLTAISQ